MSVLTTALHPAAGLPTLAPSTEGTDVPTVDPLQEATLEAITAHPETAPAAVAEEAAPSAAEAGEAAPVAAAVEEAAPAVVAEEAAPAAVAAEEAAEDTNHKKDRSTHDISSERTIFASRR